MGFGRYRFRRSFGNVASQFRGARPSTYPLFSGLLDQYPNAAAAYSLRALSSGWLAGDVVEVRRSSDSTSQDFTASQITSGAMLDFVNRGTSDLYNNAMYFDGIDNKVTGVSLPISDGNSIEFMLVAVNVANSPYALSDGTNSMRISSVYSVRLRVSSVNYTFGGGLSDGVTYKIKVTKSGGNVTVLVNDVSIGTQAIPDFSFDNVGNLGPTYLKGTIYNIKENDVVKYIGDGAANSNWLDQIGGNNGTVNGTPAAYTGQPFNGFVSTWYDQSGNANDATQATTTAQPKIVDAGSLVTGGLKFDGVDDGLAVSGQVLTSSSLYVASVMQHATGTSTSLGQTIFGQYQFSTSGRFQLSTNNSSCSFFANATNSIVGLGAGAIGTSQTLISVNGDGSNAEIWRDGISKATDTYSGFTPATVDFTIGIDSDGAREFNGKIAEIIIYPSDQSANRVGIETNINAAYSIY
jgi:hypothetical protein